MIARASFAATLLIVIALFAIPSTSWMVRKQLGALTGKATNTGPAADVSRRLESDPNVQIALAARRANAAIDAIRPDGVSLGVVALNDFARTHAHFPAVYALAARDACMATVSLDRPEQALAGWPSAPSVEPAPQSRAALDLFLKDVETGRRLEPGNGYFALLDALGLLQARRDAGALAALKAAGACNEFNEHYFEPFDGESKLLRAAIGHDDAASRLAVWSATPFPELARMRSAARAAIGLAIESEQRGDYARGIEIRRDVRLAGAAMRDQCRSTIGVLVGGAIAATAAADPAGARRVFTGDDLSVLRRRAAFCAQFMRSHGFAADAADVVLQADRNARAKSLVMRSSAAFEETTRLGDWQLIGALLILIACATAASSALCALIGRLPAMRAGQQVPAPERWGMAMGIVAIALLKFLGTDESAADKRTYCLWLAVSIAYIAAAWLATRFQRRPLARYVVSATLSAAIPLAAVAAAMLPDFALGQAMPDIATFMFAMTGPGGAHAPRILEWILNALGMLNGAVNPSPLVVAAVCAAPMASIIAGAALIALFRRRPMAATIVRGAASAGALVVCALAVAYAAAMPPTLCANAGSNREIDRLAMDEPVYAARVLRATWPAR